MATFRIVWEFDIVKADGPLEAAKRAEKMLQNPDNHWQYYVQNEQTKQISSVDLEEEDEDAVLPVENYEPIIE